MNQFDYVSPRLGKVGGAERKKSCRTNKIGGGSIYQALPYVMRGSGTRRSKKTTGGFYPSLMGGVLSNGPLLMSAAVAQGTRLLRNESERLKARRNRKTRRTASKRTSKTRKNTRKA